MPAPRSEPLITPRNEPLVAPKSEPLVVGNEIILYGGLQSKSFITFITLACKHGNLKVVYSNCSITAVSLQTQNLNLN